MLAVWVLPPVWVHSTKDKLHKIEGIANIPLNERDIPVVLPFIVAEEKNQLLLQEERGYPQFNEVPTVEIHPDIPALILGS